MTASDIHQGRRNHITRIHHVSQPQAN